MAELLQLIWEGAAPGLPRRDRAPCNYEAYIPDTLLGRSIRLDGDVAAEVADAENELTRLNARAASLVNTEVLARILLRAESVASSRIEGLEIGGRRLLRAEAARAAGDDPGDLTADEVLGNIDAMTWAVESVSEGSRISVEHVLEMHERLLSRTSQSVHAGQIRSVQNWIGGSAYNPCTAEYVPPPPEMVRGLLNDLCAFANDDSLPTVAQAAIAHAQFETIHPFVDGNGRIGRALIQLILRRRGLVLRVFPPISLILATWSKEYIHRLTGTRYRGAASSEAAHAGLNQWIALFASACQRAVADALDFEELMRLLEQDWRTRLGRVRKNSAVDLLLSRLTGAPLITVGSTAKLISRSFQATNNAISQLVDAKILTPVTMGKRNRAFEAMQVLEMFTDLERRIASPRGDTRIVGPSRRVPYRSR